MIIEGIDLDLNPGSDLPEAIRLHGEDRVYLLYKFYYHERAKAAVRGFLRRGKSPSEIKLYMEQTWRPFRNPTKHLAKESIEDKNDL